MKRRNGVRAAGRCPLLFTIIAAGAVAALAGEASAQDYSVTNTSGRFETVPAGAADLFWRSDGLTEIGVFVDLPFSFSYYGGAYDRVWVAQFGFLQFGASIGSVNASNQMFPQSSNDDGIAAPCWDQVSGRGWGWTAGTAPNRRYIVAWKDVALGAPSNQNKVSFEAILYEGTGRIVFAYTAGTGTNPWSSGNYTTGLDAPGDSRYIAVPTNSFNLTGQPTYDYQFDPSFVTVTGVARYDRIVSDATGIGNSVEAGVAAEGLRVELRSSSRTVAIANCDATGAFSLVAYAAPASTTASVVLLADSPGCIVRTVSGGTAPAVTIVPSVSLASNQSVGTLTVGTSADPQGTTRAAFDVARTLARAYSWASVRTPASIPKLGVLYTPSSGVPSAYTLAAPPAAALLQVASSAGGNDDGWDRAVVLHLYARHLLAAIAALPTTAADPRFDVATTPENAFAEAFGYWLAATQLGVSAYDDGIDATHGTHIDLESPTLSAAKGPNVAGWLTSALFDLADAANETHDRVDGSGVATQDVFVAVDTLTTAPTASSFLAAWIAAGFDGPGITRIWIADGLLADDSLEPNDDGGEATPFASLGLLRTNLTLNPLNDDWFSVPVPAAVDALLCDVSFERAGNAAQVLVEVQDQAGLVRGSATTLPGFAPVRCTTGPLGAGTYRVRVAHTGGPQIAPYSIQILRRIAVGPAQFPDWTVGRPYVVALDVEGGVAPISISAAPGGALPPGISIDAAQQRIFGTPTAQGAYSMVLFAQDSGTPSTLFSASRSVVFHAPLAFHLSEFVGFPLGRSIDTTLPTTGGTPPFTLHMTSGSLPAGLSFDPNSLRVTGSSTAVPSSALELDGMDVAGSSDHVATRGVVAHPSSGKNVIADLVTGEDACGWWFDAVEGSTVSFTATTAKGHVKRTMVGLVLAPDRSAVLSGKIKTKLGSLTGSGIVCPSSGRYYVIASSTDGDATQLLGNVHVLPPKAGKSKIPVFAAADKTTIEVGALSGATLTLKFAGDKKTGLLAKIVSVTDPTGTLVSSAAFIKATTIGGTLTMPLAVGGTWTIVLGATSQSGVPGKLSYSYAIKQPKGGVYSAD